jgi:ABC-type glycerol-3-phosphate transport system substrate-binding protein
MLMLGLILAGCASAPTSGNKDNVTAGGPGAAEETFELTFSYFGPEMIPPGHWSQEAAKRVEEKTNGRVKIKTYFSESLLMYGDTITGTASGVADISFVDSGLLAGQYDLNMVFNRFVSGSPAPGGKHQSLPGTDQYRPGTERRIGSKRLALVKHLFGSRRTPARC